jgi:hypothetical protein
MHPFSGIPTIKLDDKGATLTKLVAKKFNDSREHVTNNIFLHFSIISLTSKIVCQIEKGSCPLLSWKKEGVDCCEPLSTNYIHHNSNEYKKLLTFQHNLVAESLKISYGRQMQHR